MARKRILSAAAALVFALGAVAPIGASADKKKKEAVKFEFDKDMVTETKEPALSFDGSAYKDYIHLTRDAKKGGISFEQDKDTSYQGVSLKVKSETDGIDGWFCGSEYVRDKEGNFLYHDTPEVEDVDSFSYVGIELHCEDFGLSTFDGCLFNFAYRLTSADQGTLLGDTVWVYGADDDNIRRSDVLQLTANDTFDDNINQYRSNALASIAENAGASKLIIDMPAQKAINGEVLYIDNIYIALPDSAGGGYIANVDDYNANAKVSEIVDEIKIEKQKNDTTIADKKIKKQKDTTKKRITVFVISIVALAAAGGVFAFIKLKKRFY